MPIRPENRDRYPEDWPVISLAAKEAAGWRCAREGECGRGTHTGRCPNVHGQAAYGTGSTAVLTTAHLDHTRSHHRETAAATRRARIAAAGQLALFPDT